jgi:hypothetical protein
MSNLGCCGSRPLSIAGLLEAADALPPDTRHGLIARRRLAYTIAAAKAAQVGNRAMYGRALKGLSEVGLFTSSDPHLATAGTRIATTVRAAARGPSLSQTATQIASVVTLLASLADLAATVAGAAGGDPRAVTAAHTVTSWIRAIVNGTPPTIPTLDANTLNSFVSFCAVSTPVKALVDTAFGIAILELTREASPRPVGNGDAGAGTAATVLTTILQRLDAMLDGLCAAVATQAAPPPPAAMDCSSVPNAVPDGAGGCTCAPGYSSAIQPGQCLPEGGAPPRFRPGLIRLRLPIPITPFTLLPAACPTGTVRGADGVCRAPATGGGGSAAVIAIPAVAALWWFMR